MNGNHTKGPWRYQKEITRSFGCNPVVKFQVYREEGVYGHPASCDDEDDALLISAAPDLLEALEAIEAFDTPLPCGLLEQARAAISKAKGLHEPQ
jgi:hypothetical protein